MSDGWFEVATTDGVESGVAGTSTGVGVKLGVGGRVAVGVAVGEDVGVRVGDSATVGDGVAFLTISEFREILSKSGGVWV